MKNDLLLPGVCCKNIGTDQLVFCDKKAEYWYLHDGYICSFCAEHNYQCGEPIERKK